MFRKFSLLFQGLFLTILASSLVVACGKQDSRKRPAANGQKTSVTSGDPTKPSTPTSGGASSAADDEAKKKKQKADEEAAKLAKQKSEEEAQRLAKQRADEDSKKTEKQREEEAAQKAEKQKAELGKLQKIEQVDIELRKGQPEKDFKTAFRNSANLLSQIGAVSLSLDGSNKAKFKLAINVKVTVDGKESVVKETFETPGTVTPDDIKEKDVVLKNTSSESSKLTVTDIKLRMLEAKDYLIRITKSDTEILGLVFDESASDLKLTYVLGAGDQNATLIKNLSTITESGAPVDKVAKTAASALEKLDQVGKSLEAITSKSEIWKATASNIMSKHAAIISLLNTAKALNGTKEGKTSEQIQTIEQSGSAMMRNIRLEIENLGVLVSSEAKNGSQDADVRESLTKIGKTITDIASPGSLK